MFKQILNSIVYIPKYMVIIHRRRVDFRKLTIIQKFKVIYNLKITVQIIFETSHKIY